MVDKRSLSEQDICNRYITPNLQKSGWDIMTQIRTEYSFTDGRITIRGLKSTKVSVREQIIFSRTKRTYQSQSLKQRTTHTLWAAVFSKP